MNRIKKGKCYQLHERLSEIEFEPTNKYKVFVQIFILEKIMSDSIENNSTYLNKCPTSKICSYINVIKIL